MSIRVAINGFGRIGRSVFRALRESSGVEVIALNDLTSASTLAHLLKYDSVMGRYPGEVTPGDGSITVEGKTIRILAERDPASLPWKDLRIDVVVESTGIFRARADVQKHVDAGAGKVILTVPPADDLDAMVVLGVNDDTIQADYKLFSNASCTTNCLAPIAKVLHDSFGIEHGMMTTVHAYTNDQSVADLPHSDLRRARAAAQNIIPTSTGAARAVGKVLPELDGKLDGISLRVPVINGSIVDLTATLKTEVTAKVVNAAVEKAAASALKGIIEYTEDPIVSSDVIMNPHSAVYDAAATLVLGKKGRNVKVLAWYDNEWGYSNRVCDLIRKIAS
ncbi:MAG: type I glyceraldehyde-3-phosphate dehydrogenase [Planctomycetota bacterium]|nr:type I glyceraldehyde-3-phosphate dehydrogenase [Planctomycetota bacterium]